MNFSVQILGSSSAVPTATRFPSAQIVSYNEQIMLVDCGEGTQIQLRKFKLSFLKIQHIFISHLHGDHFYGIFGLLTSMNLLGRKQKLNIYAPKKLRKILNYLWKNTGIVLQYEVEFHELIPDSFNLIAETKNIEVYSFPLKHTNETWGFKFVEKQRIPNIRKEKIEEYNLSFADIRKIKTGQGIYMPDGKYIEYTEFTHPPLKPRSYAYCSDTEYMPNLKELIGNVDVLYHEATFVADAIELAKATNHSTSSQAGQAAADLGAKALIIGHFSSRYPKANILKSEAETKFKPVFLAQDGAVFSINRKDGSLSQD
ncbi:MAG: ribonuclease Z [Bacteroidales bacterium]|nr:ribonuclease Z [Bacteroidales bacterium]